MTMVYSFAGAIIHVVASSLFFVHPSNSQQFDPYQLNGGLVAAVAGRDYVLIASDTRLTDGGYGIKSRNYLSGRIWSAHSSSTLSTVFSSSHLFDDADNDDEDSEENGEGRNDALSKLTANPRRMHTAILWDSDGSLIAPSSTDEIVKDGSSSKTTTLATFDRNSSRDLDGIHHSYPSSYVKSNTLDSNILPVMIGSAGCASDCEALKRRMRLELDALLSCSSSLPSSSSSSRIEIQSVANLLQQILYGRRTFPFYSFCVVAGIDTRGNLRRGKEKGSGGGVGAVYVYDAIGSYERVAVACAGSGRELLQPVLDRLFSSSTTAEQRSGQRQKHTVLNDGLLIKNELSRVEENEASRTIISAEKQRMGTAGSLRPPVITHVNCPWEEAVRNVAHAYMSVAEREISVGDELVICVVNTATAKSSSDGHVINVFSYPLKKH